MKQNIWIRGLVAVLVLGYFAYDNPDWFQAENRTSLIAVVAGLLFAGALSMFFAKIGLHFSLRAHRALGYILIFPLLIILPVCLYLGQGTIAAISMSSLVGIFLFLFYVVGAACPECGARLRNIPHRDSLFAPLRQIRYRCTNCDFTYDRWDTEDPPF
ncbi:MAG: hypothetical protein KDA80_02325 [Planctomycetaceae bacterium]|nr:hypothetical protein [Planctomycetaceae bacterium]